ncbi:MAG: T9SS type A sorting domain-containing protein [Flavobacteriales bacterium]|jgi:lysyl endopeptidase
MKRFLSSFFIFLWFNACFAQQGDGGFGHYFSNNGWKTIPLVSYPTPNVNALQAEDRVLDSVGGQPWRFGYNYTTAINTENQGIWINTKEGHSLWLVRLKSPNALTINLAFDKTIIPEGNELYVYNLDKSFILGKFTSNHVYEGQLGTELVPGDEVIVEYFVKKNNPKGFVQVNNVTHGYRTAQEFYLKAFGSSGNCNLNVNCPEGGPWQQERNGVVMLVSGNSGFCSGSLINNTLNNGKPYVLTANHCFSNPATWVFRFNWQSAGCSNPGTEPTFQSLSGAILRSRASASDFCLVEITGGLQGGTVPAAYTPYFNGWDNSGNTPSSAVGIHHPSGDIKKISFENDPLISTTFGGSPANSHWGVTGWDQGVTEGGSSGSPLFDQNHRIIGQLHGGASACGAPVLSDEYGKISYSWIPNGSDSTNQLKYWLDPNQSGATFVNGYDPSGGVPVQVDPFLAAVNGVSGTFCSADISPSITLSNGGAVPLTSALITYGFDGSTNLTYPWTGNLPQWQSTTVTLPTAQLGSGTHTFNAAVSNPNTGVDENNLNNTQNSSFNVVLNGQEVILGLTLDCYGSETSWSLQNSSGTVLFTGNGYNDNNAGLVNIAWCLDFGCYAYTINDSYGDGIYGLPWCPASGSVEISSLGDSLTGISEANSDFGFETTLNFCVDGSGINPIDLPSLVIYPNPVQQIVHWKAPFPVSSLCVMDLNGKILIEESVSNSLQSSLSIEHLAKGVYYLTCELVSGEILTKKVVKE